MNGVVLAAQNRRHGGRSFDQAREIAATAIRIEAIRPLDLFCIGRVEARQRLTGRGILDRSEILANELLVRAHLKRISRLLPAMSVATSSSTRGKASPPGAAR